MCLAVPGKLIEILPPQSFKRSGRVDFGGVTKEVDISFVPEARAGEYVMTHVGFAISIVDEAEALEIQSYLRQLGESVGGEESASEVH